MGHKVKRDGLKYLGRGCGQWLHGVPARDLTEEEVQAHGGRAVLLRPEARGLYEECEQVEDEEVKSWQE